jgi:hypothetical protein
VLTIETKFADWGSNAGNTQTFSVTITNTACSCTPLAWTAPTATAVSVNIDASSTQTPSAPVADTSARASNTAFDMCYVSGNDCATTGSYANGASDFGYKLITDSSYSALPAWITWSSTDLVFAPTDPALVGTYEIAG